MRRIRFRYNKYSPGVFYIMVVLGVTLGLLILYEFIISVINKGHESIIYMYKTMSKSILLIKM